MMLEPKPSESNSFNPQSFWRQFRHGTVSLASAVRLHYVEGGSGPAILLLPGWPQSWYAWRFVMPLLTASGRRVVALDPRGVGESDRPYTGYDMTTIAADLHGVVQSLGLAGDDGVDVVGHDVGTWMAYAYAADWQKDVRRLAVFDAALPGITPPPPPGIPSAEMNLKSWHFAFNRLDDIPEILLRGREREFLTWLFHSKAVKTWAIDASDLDEYVRVAALPGATRAAFSYYRESFSEQGIAENKKRAQRQLKIPVLAYGAEFGTGEGLLKTMKLVAGDVSGGTIKSCGHYIPEEAPSEMASAISNFLRDDRATALSRS